jgi:hypothetical protein
MVRPRNDRRSLTAQIKTTLKCSGNILSARPWSDIRYAVKRCHLVDNRKFLMCRCRNAAPSDD